LVHIHLTCFTYSVLCQLRFCFDRLLAAASGMTPLKKTHSTLRVACTEPSSGLRHKKILKARTDEDLKWKQLKDVVCIVLVPAAQQTIRTDWKLSSAAAVRLVFWTADNGINRATDAHAHARTHTHRKANCYQTCLSIYHL
jgi:hypothetical protein